jgi:branched-chain amino acid transport system ATP-binding protein
MSAAILEVRGLTMDFGGIRALDALDALDLRVRRGEIVALIGPNGAGKTTFFNCLNGLYRPTAGDLLLTPPGGQTKRLNGLKPNQVTKHGLARTFQNIRLFGSMTVLENVMIGRHAAPGPGCSARCSAAPAPWPPSRSCCSWTSRPPA